MIPSSLSFTCCSLQLLASFLLTYAAARPSPGIWDINIDESPAPAPQDGPPLSASAVRDRAYLPLEVGAVFGAYFLCVIVTTSAILTVGRRLRRSAQTHPRSLAMEMMKPINTAGHPSDVTSISPSHSNPWGPSPVTPTDRKQEWPSPDLTRKQSWGTSNKSYKPHMSVQSSVVTFDESVIEEDKTKNEMEMSRLYAAVAEHEGHKEKSRSLTHQQPLSQHPPELQHLRLAAPPKSPPPRTEPLSPVRTSTTSPFRNGTTSPRSGTRSSRPTPLSMTGSLSHSRTSSRSSFGSFGRKHGSVRDLKISLPISPPMGSPEITDENTRYYEDAEPLTPRQYNPGPPPTPPHGEDPAGPDKQHGMSPIRTHFSRHFSTSIRSSRGSAPTSPITETPRNTAFPSSQTPRTSGFPASQTPRTSTFSASQTPRTATFPPSQTPQTSNFPASTTPRTATFPTFTVTHESVESLPRQLANESLVRQVGPKQRKPAPLALRTHNVSESTASLPLRTAPLPLRNLGTPGFGRPQSTIKATVLEHKIDNHLRAPGTGVPATPYSPFYFPQTPLTPMTPSRLVTREERRRQKKEEGRRVATMEDAVIEEKDMWGDAY